MALRPNPRQLGTAPGIARGKQVSKKEKKKPFLGSPVYFLAFLGFSLVLGSSMLYVATRSWGMPSKHDLKAL